MEDGHLDHLRVGGPHLRRQLRQRGLVHNVHHEQLVFIGQLVCWFSVNYRNGVLHEVVW
jgi:hypothetical protein